MDVVKYNEIFSPDKWGEVVSLQTGYKLLDKDGKVIDEREWKSQSYVRWMGILIEQMFSGMNARGGNLDNLTDYAGNIFQPQWAATNGFQGQSKFVPAPNNVVGGAMMNIGTGGTTNDSSLHNLRTPFTGPAGDNYFTTPQPYDASQSVYTTQEDGVAIEFAIQQGITNNSSTMVTISEQALFGRCRASGDGTGTAPKIVMFAYDVISPGVSVNIGQTFVPKYTLRFQA